MKNADQPAYPITEAEKDRLDTNPDISYMGLTKREYFAAMAMQGLLSCQHTYGDFYKIAGDAVALSDSLLQQIENQKQK
jgi:hypothetical protein